ncbi:hypothetical protein DEJ30_13975 [Curtobacterium sp. MCPF17_003]|uniref:hypothetical protein n=1 Tax=Curtobacterium sp. MCPF17_003 TaxID=2175637 RepID=UPI000D847A29|nr:hypothetical protein [Curtobacterium sp. MCPF17_003]PYY63351.1 hypothetical protein DEJ30_13975 [Curtobacterium sp. MCPF17_003]
MSGTTLSFLLGTTEYKADATNVTLTWDDADSGTVTFADAEAGGKFQATLSGTAIQSTTATSFWTYAWLNVGTTVAFKLAPNGNTTASADAPIFSGNVKIGKRPDLGGDAQISGDDWTFDFEWTVIGDVTRAVS